MSETEEDVDELPIDDEENEEEEEEEEEDFWEVYDADTFISDYILSAGSTIPEDILVFDFSFGYDCKRFFNLTVADPDTLMFASGNLINIFDVPNKSISFRRSALGGGIGHIKMNPSPEFNHIAIAENGDTPLIIIYEWPELQIISVLRGGSSKLYSHLDFSPDGELMASQGGEPDYLITVWNWMKRVILLRTKSYVNDVCRVKFSPYCPGQLTTCGTAHIKFWKMCETFTGLKLKGELGRFGKTEFSDIEGLLPMPDEKVVSGCSWGNILIWDAGLIKLEVFRTLRRRCHEGPIIQISYSEGELWTVSLDGHVKVWWYEKIDQADPPDDDRVVQIEPSYDFYTPGLMLMCLRKRYPDPLDTTFFGQDGNGGIWLIDLNTDATPNPSEQLYKCHAGKVVDIAACPFGTYIVTLGEDGRLYLYNYAERTLVFTHEFPALGACMLWLPIAIAQFGDEIIMGFDDGTLRVCILSINTNEEPSYGLKVVQAIKPHENIITKIVINPSNTILVSAGDDKTIFVFKITAELCVNLVPIGYIRVPSPVTCLTWIYNSDDEILVGCLHGEIIQTVVPYEPQDYTTVSYLLDLTIQSNVFITYKAQIRRDLHLMEIAKRKEGKVEQKRVKMNKLKAENPGLDIDEEVFLADSETEEELEPLHIPDVPNRVIWMQSTDYGTIWLSMGGYDAGYIYEYKIDQKEEVPFFFQMVDDGDDTEISSYLYNCDKFYLIFAMQTGEIRVNKLDEPGAFRNLSNYWSLPMHDNENGFVPTMCFSYDETYFFTCGHDGNVFSFKFNPEEQHRKQELNLPPLREEPIENSCIIKDKDNYKKMSLEKESLKREQDRIDALANANKKILRDQIKVLELRYGKLLERNKKLLPSQIIPKEELELDPRVTQAIDQNLADELALVKRKLEFDVLKSEVKMKKLKKHFVDCLHVIPFTLKGINSDLAVNTLRQRMADPTCEEILELVNEKLTHMEAKGRVGVRVPQSFKQTVNKKSRHKQLEYFLLSLPQNVIEERLGPKLNRLLGKYRDRKLKWEQRDDEWEKFKSEKPVKGVNPAEDEENLQEAIRTIGDLKLKTADNYTVSKEQQTNTVTKYRDLLISVQKQHEIRNSFTRKVCALRDEKVRLRLELLEMQKNLYDIHEEILKDRRKMGPSVPDEDPLEFTERFLEVTEKLELEPDDVTTKRKPIVFPFKDAEREVLLHRKLEKKDKKDNTDVSGLDFESLLVLSKYETKDTPWEKNLRLRRFHRKIFEQDRILFAMSDKIANFNNKIRELMHEKYQVVVDGKLMDVHVVTLHNEIIILKEFEAVEEELQDNVSRKMTELLTQHDVINEMHENISNHTKEIEKLNDELKLGAFDFNQHTQDNKFYEFLKKVFKKKYKPPKTHNADESSSESSSSSSETESEDDGRSIDSRDFGIIKQDLNVCPKGCDPAIYDFTVKSRAARHEIEKQIRENTKKIEILKVHIDMENKKRRVVEKGLEQSRLELEAFQREKQKKVNQVRCTVELRLDQLQHIKGEEINTNIMKTLVITRERVTKMYRRVDELQSETDQLKLDHQTNVRHYTRMITDIKHMTKVIKGLKRSIVENMLIKFGKVVDINEIELALLKRTFGKDDLCDLEEVLMKKLVHDLKMSAMDIRGSYIPMLREWQERIIRTQRELIQVLRENTSHKELLCILGKEKVDLAQSLTVQEKKKSHLEGISDFMEQSQEEIDKLDKILETQNYQIIELKQEIQMLKTKGMVVKPEKHFEEIKEKPLRDWHKFEDMIEETEEKESHIHFAQEITIPTPLTESSKKVATALLSELLDNLNITLTRKSSDNFIQSMIHDVMRGLSAAALKESLIKNLPVELEEQQLPIVEMAAEQLYVVPVEGVVTEKDIEDCGKELIEDIIDEVLLTAEGPTEIMARIVLRLVDELPGDFIDTKKSLEAIISKLVSTNIEFGLDQHEFMEMVRSEEARNLLEDILQKVFDTGLDLIYYISD